MASLTTAMPAQANGFRLQQTSYNALPGWNGEDHLQALRVFVSACEELTTSGVGFARKAAMSGSRNDWLPICADARQATSSPGTAQQFFETRLVPVTIMQVNGQFTGYFEPEVEGSRNQSATFNVPVLARPDDLVRLPKSASARLDLAYGRMEQGKAKPYYTRQQIEQGVLSGRNLEIVYLSSWEDLFFMQIQGSGRVKLADGSSIRLGYAAKTGLPYTSIGKVLIDRGEMTRDAMSMQGLRSWLKANPSEAREVMWENKSYVFFRELKGHAEDSGPVGAQKLPLTPLRSLAVDRRFWALGVPVWVSTSIYANGVQTGLNRIMVAQDTGSAIRGPARGDVFMGTGVQAGLDAGLMDQVGSMTALLPKSLAARLLKKHGQ